VFEVATEAICHLICNPRAVYVDSDTGGLSSVEIIDAEGSKQIVVFQTVVALRPPSNVQR
jgi:hypothetical protein